MNILVSSLSFLSLDTVSRHLQLSNQSILSTISQHSYSAAVFTVRDSGGVSAVINGSINSFCATYYGQDTTPANLAANSLLFVYSNEKSRLNLLQNSRHSEYSCVLVDEDSGTAVISMDAAGAVPLWYTLTDNADGQKQFIVTSDIILGYKLGFNALSAAGPGQTVSFDFRSNEMVSFSHWQGSWLASAHQNSKKTMANAYANTLLASALSVMNSTVRGEGYIHLTTEFDPMDQSTHFLECVLDTLQVDRLVRLRQPLVEDRFVDSSAYIDLLGMELNQHFI